jgi:TRAP-type C4-dicarboxylate transport system permease small subunit
VKPVEPRLLRWLHRTEDALITILVLGLVGLAGAQIVLRNVFGSGISWADPLLRALVLWVGLLGALAAVREDKHIGLDVASRLLKGVALRVVRLLTYGFAAIICAMVAWYSFNLVQIEIAGGTVAFAGIPAWAVEIILPFAFGLMWLRFVLRALTLPIGGPHLPPGVPDDLIEADLIKDDLIKDDLIEDDR